MVDSMLIVNSTRFQRRNNNELRLGIVHLKHSEETVDNR